jgi:hypothetical protein
LNRRGSIPDNGAAGGQTANGMQGEREGTRGRAVWPRRALVSLWVLAFALVGGALAARWDALVARLAGPPAAGGALR